MNPITESIGIIATIVCLVSMLFKTTSIKGAFRMRLLNLIASIIFIVYGVLLPALSTLILNAILLIVNIYHLILLAKENNVQKHKTETQE